MWTAVGIYGEFRALLFHQRHQLDGRMGRWSSPLPAHRRRRWIHLAAGTDYPADGNICKRRTGAPAKNKSSHLQATALFQDQCFGKRSPSPCFVVAADPLISMLAGIVRLALSAGRPSSNEIIERTKTSIWCQIWRRVFYSSNISPTPCGAVGVRLWAVGRQQSGFIVVNNWIDVIRWLDTGPKWQKRATAEMFDLHHPTAFSVALRVTWPAAKHGINEFSGLLKMIRSELHLVGALVRRERHSGTWRHHWRQQVPFGQAAMEPCIHFLLWRVGNVVLESDEIRVQSKPRTTISDQRAVVEWQNFWWNVEIRCVTDVPSARFFAGISAANSWPSLDFLFWHGLVLRQFRVELISAAGGRCTVEAITRLCFINWRNGLSHDPAVYLGEMLTHGRVSRSFDYQSGHVVNECLINCRPITLTFVISGTIRSFGR